MTAAGIGFDPSFNLSPNTSAAGGVGAPPGSAPEEVGSGALESFTSILRTAASGSGAVSLGGGRQDLPAGSGSSPPEIQSGDDPAWAALAQLIQGMMVFTGASGAAAEPMDPEAAPEADPGTEDEGLLRFIDILKQLDALQTADALHAGRLMETLHGLLADDSRAAEDETPSGLIGRLRQWLGQAHTTVPAGGWDRLVQLVTGQGAGSGHPLRPQASGETAMPAETTALGATATPDETATAPVARGAWEAFANAAPLRELRSAGQTDSGPQRSAHSGDEGARPMAAERSGSAGSAGARAIPAPANALDSALSPQMPAAAPVREAALAAGRDGAGGAEAAPPAVSRPAVVPPLAAGAAEMTGGALREAGSLAAFEPGTERIAEAGGSAKPREAAVHAAKSDVVDQIVQRAAVLLKSDRGEARIDLKPEFLGQVRMHIVTDNQLVSVRILTESPMVRDLIEHHLHQLKSDLQQQGLQVERVEVSVADDPRRHAGRHAPAHGGRNGHGLDPDEGATTAAVADESRRTPADWGAAGRGTINMFV